MSGRYNIVKEFIVKPAAEAVKKVFKKEPKSVEYVVPKIAKNLKSRREEQQKLFKIVDDAYKKAGVKPGSAAAKIKKEGAKKSSELQDKFEKGMKAIEDKYQKKAKGGRIGLKLGTGRKSNLQKIQETFGPKQVKKKQKPKVRMMAKKGSKPKKKFPDLTGDGKVTFADVLKGRGVINGKKKQKKKII
jgi:hypothetical protein